MDDGVGQSRFHEVYFRLALPLENVAAGGSTVRIVDLAEVVEGVFGVGTSHGSAEDHVDAKIIRS